jgi:hypothetical protein
VALKVRAIDDKEEGCFRKYILIFEEKFVVSSTDDARLPSNFSQAFKIQSSVMEPTITYSDEAGKLSWHLNYVAMLQSHNCAVNMSYLMFSTVDKRGCIPLSLAFSQHGYYL